MSIGARAIAAALVLCGGVAAAFAQELSLRQPDGKIVTVIDDKGAGGPLLQWIERRNPDGSLDLAFGDSGRVPFSLSDDILEPRSLSLDAQGRLVLAGAALGAGDRATAVVSRFLPDGRVDSRWGTQGTSRVASTDGNVRAVDSLAMPDQGMLLLGQLDTAASQKVVLYRLRFDGTADASFGRGGILRLAALDGAQPTSLRQDDDMSVLIASQRPRAGGGLLLETHRWQPGQDGVQLAARQDAPPGWSGPATLERRDGRWQWTDAALAAALPLVFADAAPSLPGATMGQAAFSPFAPADAAPNPEARPASGRGFAPGPGWLWLVPAAAVLGIVTWRRRSARATDLGLLNARPAMVDAAMADLARASSARDDDRTHAKVQGADVEPAPPASGMEQPVLAPPIELEPATFAPTDELLRPVLAPPDEPQRPPPAPPDDLKRIKGIGAVLEKRLNGEGIFYFQQIARWRPEDVAEVSARLSAFKGRIERDRWVPQAIELAS